MRFLKDFGALVAIALAALGGAVAYGTQSSQVLEHGQRLDRLEPAVQQVQTDGAVIKQRLDDFGKSLDRIEDKLGTRR